MRKHIKYISTALLVLALSGWQGANAARVFQWTDAEGVTHFSDVPPAGADKQATTREYDFVDYTSRENSADEFSIINQLERMTDWRRQITEERLAKKELQLEEQRLANEQQQIRYYPAPRPSVYPSHSYIHPATAYPARFFHNNKRRFHSRQFGKRSGRFSKDPPSLKLRHYQLGSD